MVHFVGINIWASPVVRALLFFALLILLAEIAAFLAIMVVAGFAWAFGLVVFMSLAGALILRHAGGNHIARVRAALGEHRLSALRADGSDVTMLIAGLLLLLPGFISGFFGILLLGWSLMTGHRRRRRTNEQADGVVDLDPQDWRTIPDPDNAGPRLPDRGNRDRGT